MDTPTAFGVLIAIIVLLALALVLLGMYAQQLGHTIEKLKKTHETEKTKGQETTKELQVLVKNALDALQIVDRKLQPEKK